MELIIKIENDSSIESITKAISKIKGVISVSKLIDNGKKRKSKSLSPGLQKLMGCVTYTPEEIDADSKLSYLFSK